MKKYFLKKLQSLTAILVLNSVPLGIAQTGVTSGSELLSSRVVVDERKGESKNSIVSPVPIEQLFFDNSLTYIQKHNPQAHSYHHQVALAMIEEVYQDGFDLLLDQYEQELEVAVINNDANQLSVAKANFQLQLQQLKHVRLEKIVEFNTVFSDA